MNTLIKNIISKHAVGIVLFLVMALGGVAYPRPAHAIPVKVIANIVQIPFDTIIAINQQMDTISTIIQEIKDKVLDPLAWVRSKVELAKQTNRIVSQIQNGRIETGLGLFVQDWQLVGELQRRKAANSFIRDLSSSQVDPAFKNTLLRSFRTNPYGNQSVFNRLRPTFKDDVSSYPGCEDGSCDTRAFLNDFSKGGWLGFQSLTNNPAHNPFTAYNILLQDKTEREERAKQAALDEARASQGFLGTQDCPPEPAEEPLVPEDGPMSSEPDLLTPEEGPMSSAEQPPEEFVGPPEPPKEESIIDTIGTAFKTARCKITRPGSSVAQDLFGALQGSEKVLSEIDEFSELVGSILGLTTGVRDRGLVSHNLESARSRIEESDRLEASRTFTQAIAEAQRALESVDDIYRQKQITRDKNSTLIAELERLVARSAQCPDLASFAEDSLSEAQDRQRQLDEEIGVGGTLGTFARGGAHVQNLAKKLADAQFLVKIIENNGISVPNDQISQNLRDAFDRLENDPQNDNAQGRVREARGWLEISVAELQTVMIPFRGGINGFLAELRQVESGIRQVASSNRTCNLF